jgi:hypothetical protein
MEKAFREEINKLQYQALQQAKAQSSHGSMLTKILSMLKQNNFTYDTLTDHKLSEAANHPQTEAAGDSPGVAGQG